MELSIGVLEDDALTRVALTDALKSHGFKVPISCASAADFIAKATKAPLDAVLLDLHLGEGPTGIDVAHHLRERSSILGIVFLTSFEDPRLLTPGIRGLPRGVRYVTKHSVDTFEMLEAEIAESIRASKEIAAQVGSQFSRMTDGQMETLRLIAEGLSNQEIARRRFVTEKTVEATISRILKQLSIDPQSGVNVRVLLTKFYYSGRGIDFSPGTKSAS